MGVAAPLAAGVMLACGLLALRFGALWPPLMGQLAFAAALAYMLRIGTLFTTDGPLAGDGVLGLYVPVIALGGWTLVASLMLARR